MPGEHERRIDQPALIVFGGLPGVGKTTLARRAAKIWRAVYLRIDAIEQSALRSWPHLGEAGSGGYELARDVARDQLRSGLACVIDCVNPFAEAREIWRTLANEAAVRTIEIEVVCSDRDEHRRRIEARHADIPGHRLPSWADVLARDYRPWDRDRTIVDTAVLNEDAALAVVLRVAAVSE